MSVVLTLVLFGGGLFVYFSSKSTETGGTTLVETLKKLNPFGSSDPLGLGSILGNNPFTNTATSTIETGVEIESTQSLFKLSNERSSGIAFADVLVPKTVEVRKRITIDDPLAASSSKPRKIQVFATTTETVYATTSRIRYVEQGSGHIYEYDYASSTSRKLTNTTLPKTQEAYFLAGGTKVLLRYLDATNRNVENYLATIPTSSVADKLTGEFLPANITAISVSPTTSEFFYVAKTSSGSIGNIYNVKSGTEKRVFASPFSEWLPAWANNGVFMTTKAASSFQGFTYLQSITSSNFTRITGNKLGLTTNPNPSGNKLLIGEGSLLSILDIATGTTIAIPGLYTLPEKCVWESSSTFIFCFGSETTNNVQLPENWYQGKTSFYDSLFHIDAVTGEIYKLASIDEIYTSDAAIDAILPVISKDGDAMVFINKIDMTPWYLNLKDVLFSL